MSESDRSRVLAAEQEILTSEGPYHVAGIFYANHFDAERQRRWLAERRVSEASRAAAYAARQLDVTERPRVGTWLAPRERARIEAATSGHLALTHRDALAALGADLRAGAIDAVLLSVAQLRTSDVTDLATVVRDFPGCRVVGVVADVDETQALAATLALGRAGAHAIIDARDARGYTALRSAFGAEQLPCRFVRHALAELTAPVTANTDTGAGNQCTASPNAACAPNAATATATNPTPSLAQPATPYTAGWRQFLATAFAPRTQSVKHAAAELGVPHSTLISRFYRAGLPSPKRYVAFARLVWAAHLGETPGLSLAAIAMRIDASSPQSFGRTVRNLTGLTGGEWRRQTTGSTMLATYRATLIDPYRATLATFDPLSASVIDRQPRRSSPRPVQRRRPSLAGRAA